jgi:hypothetical protein
LFFFSKEFDAATKVREGVAACGRVTASFGLAFAAHDYARCAVAFLCVLGPTEDCPLIEACSGTFLFLSFLSLVARITVGVADSDSFLFGGASIVTIARGNNEQDRN